MNVLKNGRFCPFFCKGEEVFVRGVCPSGFCTGGGFVQGVVRIALAYVNNYVSNQFRL